MLSIEGEILGIRKAIESRNEETVRLQESRNAETAKLEEMVADMEKIKADCVAKAAKHVGTGKGIGAGWAKMYPGTDAVNASHRSGASNTGVFSAALPYPKSTGGRRARRSKTRKMRSKSRRSRRRY